MLFEKRKIETRGTFYSLTFFLLEERILPSAWIGMGQLQEQERVEVSIRLFIGGEVFFLYWSLCRSMLSKFSSVAFWYEYEINP